MSNPDNTLDPTTIAALPADSAYVTDEAAATAAGNATLSATEAQDQLDRDLATFRATNLT